MKQAVMNYFGKIGLKESINFLMILKEYISRYNHFQEMYLLEMETAKPNPVLLRDKVIQRNIELNHILAEIRSIDGIVVPENVRPWQMEVSDRCLFLSQLFQVLSDSDVRHCVTAA